LPSRCALATGLYPHNNGSYSNFREVPLNPDLPNIYSVFKQAGYTTAHFGKCHYAPVPYGDTRPDATLPYAAIRDFYVSLGIDHLALQDGNQVSVWFSDDYSQELDEAGYLEAYRAAIWDKDNRKVFEFPGPAEWHPDSWVGRKAADYVASYDQDDPLLMWVSFSGPHYPFDAPAAYFDRVDINKDQRIYSDTEFDDPSRIHAATYHGRPDGGIDGLGSAPDRAMKNYSDEYWHTLRRTYFANIVQIDDYVGHILDAIEAQFGDNCLILFTADHGEMLGNHSLWGKNNCAYEDVWKVPLLAKFPGQHDAQITDAKTMLIDILPTCMDAAGIDGVQTDGVPLRERIQAGGAEYVFAEGEGFLAVSDGSHKLVRVAQEERSNWEFLDLSTDPYEFMNQISNDQHAHKIAELQSELMHLLMQDALS
jgi:arylsulfatase A-like enzyme